MTDENVMIRIDGAGLQPTDEHMRDLSERVDEFCRLLAQTTETVEEMGKRITREIAALKRADSPD